jgi:hypothetical protein
MSQVFLLVEGVFENMVLRKTLDPERQEVIGGWM